MNYQDFSSEICGELKYYVYRLLDPRNGETFYVGKGKNNRIFEHLRCKNITNEISDKIKRINDIHNAGLACILIIHRHGLDEEQAFHVEAALIEAYPQLTNEQGGHKNNKLGVMTVNDVRINYGAETINESNFDKFKVLIIKVGSSLLNGMDIYNATRYSWKLSVVRAREADFVLSVERESGLIKQIYKVSEWLEANNDNFPMFEVSLNSSGRYGFNGVVVDDLNIVNIYKNKRIPEKYRKSGMQNPILYNY